MIFGSVDFYSDEKASSIPENISNGRNHNSLVFHPISCRSFDGGYYLHPALPYTNADFYFNDVDSGTLVLLSGTVYNRTELLSLLNIAAPVPDPELIAGLFRREGPGFVDKLNGDFAICILQPAKKQAFLFRDQVGIRAIAYHIDSQALYFSTDITGLCRAFSQGGAIDSDYLMGKFKYIDYRKTPFEKVKKLMPGHFLLYSENGIEIKKYWNPENIRPDKFLSHSQMLSDLNMLLSDAVRIRCDSRFRAGTHVSGGIDSGLVSLMARKEYSHQDTFFGFSWSPANYLPGDIKYDERELVRNLCRAAGITPVFSDLDSGKLTGIVTSFILNHGFFSEDRTVSQAVDAGVNLIFSGWGGDEFVSTAAPSIETDLLRSLKLGLFLKRNKIRQPGKFIRNVVFYILMPALGILDRGTVRSFRDDARYLKKSFKKSDRKAVRQFYFHTSRHHHHIGMLNFYHLQNRCENWFVMGYAHGIEYRFPLLDKRIIEFMLRVPSELLCKTDLFRPLLREISEDILPDEIRLNRSKNDPVYWSWMDELFGKTAPEFMQEVDTWKRNPDLLFVDFDLLKQNIAKYKDHSHVVDNKVLFRTLIYLKAIHEFTLAYRK
ncbi:MAG TPA: hypothetical protein DCY25_13105 [Bacteroidales bacterium]|nr:hypothetical protein [Bacteroidales bacterium]